MIQDALKALKDGGLSLLPALIGVLFTPTGSALQIAMFIASAVVMILGVVTNTVTKDYSPLTMWGKVLKDFILGLCSSAVPIIQNGASAGNSLTMILGTIGITALSIFANVISEDVTANTILAKIAKDFGVLGIGAITPIFTTALSTGQSIGIAVGSVAVALLTVGTNVIKSDFLDQPSMTTGMSPSPQGTTTGTSH